MAESVAARRAKLTRAQQLLSALVRANEEAARLETQLEAQGLSEAEVEITMDKVLSAAGPPTTGSSVSLIECTGDTITDRLVNVLNSNVSGGVDWSAEAA